MMDDNVAKAYDYLTPKDQLVADCVIIALYEHASKNYKMSKEVMELLSKSKEVDGD